MSIYADDVLSFISVLKLAYNFLTGKDYLKRKKVRERKKVISVALGFPDLAFAVGALPVFPIRMEDFKINNVLMALNSAKTVLGWNLTSKVLDLLRQIDVFKLVDKILDDVINTVNDKYNDMYELGLTSGIPSELCYGVNALYGMHESAGKQVDANLNFAMRCLEYNKYSRSLESLVPNQIWVDIPPKTIANQEDALNTMIININDTINKLQALTGNLVTDESLKKQFRIGNQIKRFYKTILYEISASNFYPCNPATFAEILALLTISFQDYNSNAQRYLENISQLVKEMRERIKKKIGMDVSGMPKILLTPMWSGWEPTIHEIIFHLGGRIMYADWDILGLLDEISVSNKSDSVTEYAKFLLNASRKGIGCDHENLIQSYIQAAKELKVDGIIFNRVFGCSSLSNTYDQIKNSIQTELGLPAIVINFKKIGEDIEGVRSNLSQYMESFK